MNLIIVESPTKAKTIQKFLGAKYKITSSFGHVRDLPKSELGVDVENDFAPKYIIPQKARKTVTALKKELAKAKTAILATDEDREGEAIAWHLAEVLKLKNPQRIVFHEITKSAIQEALKNPRTIEMNLVDAQQARRILDRIVGYKLSPFLWKKVARGLSAGRVQSVALRLVVEREREIQSFKAQEYWSVEASLKKQNNEKEFIAVLAKKDGHTVDKLEIKDGQEAEKIVKDLSGAEYKVENIEKKEVKKNPLPPFTTSTLQQEAWKKLHMTARATMSVAQRLYEQGFITYHRTDSLNLSEQSLFSAQKFIKDNFGENYWAGFFRKYKAKGRAQEAHEAIRPTFADNTSELMSKKIDSRNLRLYDLIWRRFIACQMAQAVFDSTGVEIKAKNYGFKTNGQVLKFDGFLKIYQMKFSENDLPEMEKGETLDLLKISPNQHFTQPPARYNEASLIKTLEENGIGRPSTYAPTLSTVQERNYIEKNEERKFKPTEIGTVVNDILVEHFPEIVDIQFTAKMEYELDEVAEGKDSWVKTCRDFYAPFAKNLAKKYEEVSKKEFTEKPTDKICPKCGSPLIIRLGRFGEFYACSAFPKCRHTEPLESKALGIKCPKCKEGDIVAKRTKKNKIFYACSKYPDCDFALWDKPLNETCPSCGSQMIETKRKQKKCSNKDCQTNKKVAE